MKITLPIVTRDELVNGKRIFEYEDRAMDADFSLGMQLRWESKFPEIASQCSILEYAERVKNAPENEASVLSKIKCVYCFLDTDIPFIKFIKLFDFSRKEYVTKLLQAINDAITVMQEGAAEKN